MANIIKIYNERSVARRATSAYWQELNDVLLDGELGIETDTHKFKFGDGSTPWNDLEYAVFGMLPGTEIHTLTEDELEAKSFNLLHKIAAGQEDNILCFVQGLAQATGIAFSASGNTLSWLNKTLDGKLSAGDVFIIQYYRD